jgi:dipeptidyl aminopeptidase/acylaminoacyl peptidase
VSRRPLRPDDLFEVRWLSDVQLSPDGLRVACVETLLSREADGLVSRILVVDVEAGATTEVEAPHDATDASPRWAPDGSRLAFVAGRAGGRRAWVADADGASPRALPGSPAGVAELDWSPAGDALVVAVRGPEVEGRAGAARWQALTEVITEHYKRDGFTVGDGRVTSHLELVPLDGGPARQLTPPTSSDRRPAWSPDGRSIAFLSDRGLEGRMTTITNLWSVAVGDAGREAATPVRLTGSNGPIAAFAWCPDGGRLAVLGHEQGNAAGVGSRLRMVPSDGRRAVAVPIRLADDPPFALGLTPRSDDGRGMGDATLQWAASDVGERIWLRWADRGRGVLGWVAPNGAWQEVVGGQRAALCGSVAPGAGRMAFIVSDPGQPGEVHVADLEGGDERGVTDRNHRWLARVALGPTRLVRAVGPAQRPLEAWLTLPPGDATDAGAARPLVVSVHGGPHYPVGWRFGFEAHRLAALGYAVLAGNPRGSLGYGDDFGTAIVGDWGGDDLADVLALTAAATDRPEVDADRVAITGVSYGGYVTLWALTQVEGFRAAIAENALSDLLGAYGTGEGGPEFWLAELGVEPWQEPAAYVERSAIRHADRITTPLLLLHAELDQNVPVGQSEQLYAALVRLGRPVRFVRAPGEGHLMNLDGSARFRLERMALVESFLAQHLGA